MSAISDLKYIEILRKNARLGDDLADHNYHMLVLSNTVTAQLNKILQLRQFPKIIYTLISWVLN